ncbi:phage portal protein [Aeromicrobium panaciterrae]|uniref:hypothetical protein n=1 Tax=Aeromicrobium panaciterrae TaxID=363861 RepID=UPI0031E0EDDE
MESNAAAVPYSDEWWFKQLYTVMHHSERRLNDKKMSRVEWFDLLWRHYTGDAPLPDFAPTEKKKAAREVMRMGRANIARLSVTSLLDRIRLKGVHIISNDSADVSGDDGDDGDGSDAARRLMKANARALQDTFRYAAVMSEGILWISNPTGDKAVATAEDPRQCVTINDPLDPDKVVAAMKIYADDLTKYVYAHVALPADENGEQVERVRVARRKGRSAGLGNSWSAGPWEWVDTLSDEEQKREPKGANLPVSGRGVFVHRFQFTDDMGLFEPNLDLLNRINNMIVDRLWISKFQTFRQRALQDATEPGSEVDPLPDTDEETGEKIDYDDLFESDPDAMWKLPQGVKIWESQTTDLQPALLSVRDDIKEFAAVTRTPLTLFVPDAVGGSAEGAALARESQVFHADAIIERWNQIVSDVAANLLVADGQALDPEAELEPIWLPTERYSLLQRSQAALAAKNTGIPQEGIWADFWQLDPATIARYKRMRNKDLLFGDTPPAPQTESEPVTEPADGPADA